MATRLTGQDASGTSAAASVAAVYASTPTQNNLLIAAVWANVTTGVTTITGWTLAVESVTGSTAANGSVALFYKVAGAGESTTVTANATGASVMRSQIYEYSGVATSSLTDGTSSANSGATAGTTQAAAAGGQLATTNANDLLIAAWGFNGSASSPSVDSSFTLLLSTTRLVSADRIVSSTSTYNPTLTWVTSLRSGGVIAAFKEAAGGTPGTFTTSAGDAAADGGSATFTGAATFSSTVGDAPAAGGSSTFTGAAVFTSSVGDAPADGGSSSFVGAATFSTTVGDAGASGGTSTFAGAAVFTSTAGGAAASGGSTSFTAGAVFGTVAGGAAASGGVSTFVVVVVVLTDTPPERVFSVLYEDRVYVVPAEDRTDPVLAEARTQSA